MSKRAGLWLVMVFCVSVLAQLPASWVVSGLGLPATGGAGSIWQGQATQWGQLGLVRWHLQPWRISGQVQAGFQGQDWQAQVSGWPWAWRAELAALGAQARVPVGYRLVGQWQGAISMQGSGWGCSAAQGQLQAHDLTLVEPWSLGLGRATLQMDCSDGWNLSGTLQADGQHHGRVDADLLRRQAKINLELEPDTGLVPILRGAQLLGMQALQMQRRVSW
jgi:general secretion pathway protein N